MNMKKKNIIDFPKHCLILSFKIQKEMSKQNNMCDLHF